MNVSFTSLCSSMLNSLSHFNNHVNVEEFLQILPASSCHQCMDHAIFLFCLVPKLFLILRLYIYLLVPASSV